jgi:bifunctional non-homologous end joining protein LigD
MRRACPHIDEAFWRFQIGLLSKIGAFNLNQIKHVEAGSEHRQSVVHTVMHTPEPFLRITCKRRTSPRPPVWPLPPRAVARYFVDVPRVQFNPPAVPKLRASPATGDGWLYELKFDGYRVQLHKEGLSSTIYGRNGGDFTCRFPAVAAAVLGLPTKSCIIDGELIIDAELIAAGHHGEPDFLALLHGRHAPTCVYCFNLPELNGRDLREQPLVQRRARLQALLARAKCNVIRFSEAFPDAHAAWLSCCGWARNAAMPFKAVPTGLRSQRMNSY